MASSKEAAWRVSIELVLMALTWARPLEEQQYLHKMLKAVEAQLKTDPEIEEQWRQDVVTTFARIRKSLFPQSLPDSETKKD